MMNRISGTKNGATKMSDFRQVNDEEIQRIEYLLKSLQRKRLGWKAPYEVLFEMIGVHFGFKSTQ